MPIFNLEEFKVALIKSDEALRADLAERFSTQGWYYTDIIHMMERVKTYVHPYNFNQDAIECHWYYGLHLIDGAPVRPKHTLLGTCRYVIGFTAPEEQRRPFIEFNSLFYSIYEVMNVLYEEFELVPDNYGEWFDMYFRDVIFKNQDVDKLIKFVNDEHVKAKVTEATDIFYKTILERAVAEQWVEGAAYMLRFMKDNDIYEEQEEIRL